MHPNDPTLHAVERPLVVINGQTAKAELEARADNGSSSNSLYGAGGDSGSPYRHLTVRPWQLALTRAEGLQRPEDVDYTFTNSPVGAQNQVHVFTTFNALPVEDYEVPYTNDPATGKPKLRHPDEIKALYRAVAITDDDFTTGDIAQLDKGMGLMLMGSCSILNTGLKPIGPFKKLRWDLPFYTDAEKIEYEADRVATNSESARWHLGYYPPKIEEFDPHVDGMKAMGRALREVLEPLFTGNGDYPRFEVLNSYNILSSGESKLYLTGLTTLKRDITFALCAMAFGNPSGAEDAAQKLFELPVSDLPSSIRTLREMCASMYHEYLVGNPEWFDEQLYPGFVRGTTMHRLVEEVPAQGHYSLFSSIEESHSDVFALSTDGANPGQIVRIAK